MKHKIIIILLFFPAVMLAQEPLQYWKKPAEFMQEQTKQTFSLVENILKENPPAVDLNNARKSALMNLDWVVHDPRLDSSDLTGKYLTNRVRKVVHDLKMPVKKGVKVFKMYNHAFIIKSPTVTIAFDLTRAGQGSKKPMISDELMDSLVKHCDVLFVSHFHGDHADSKVGDLFIQNKKDVVATTGIWKNKVGVQHLRSEEILRRKIDLISGKQLDVTIMPGHQDDVPNNVYIVKTPEGISVAHTGDQWNKDKDGWIDHVKENTKVDILLVHCWAFPLERIVNGFNPKVVIPGHENEIVHSIDHRESYWLNYRRMEKVTHPIVYMTWGEQFSFKK